ncbi:ATP-binding protein [Alkalibacterium iburiense]|uniref:histidine kinase n=1 Tax=Alkalibacterium iburiense TaxID=290589 RepID=A0ABN0XCD8_9LACT
MKQLRIKILSLLSLFLILFTLLFLFLISSILESQTLEQQGEDLQAQLLTLSSQLDERVDEPDDLIDSLSDTAEIISERITLVSLTGEVLYDSHADASTLENHIDRPEIQQVISGEQVGVYDRESESTGEVLYYTATYLEDSNGEELGFIRLSKSIEEMVGVTNQTMLALAAFMGIAIIVSLLFTQYWTKQITQPLGHIKQVAEKLSLKDYTAKYKGNSYKEIDELGRTINELATSLDYQVQEIEENETQLRELINHLVIGVMVVDNERKIDMVNPAMNEILGENLYGNIGRTYNEGIYSAGLVELIEKAFKKKKLQNKEVTLYFPEERIIDVNVVPIFGQTDLPINYIVLLYDITEIRRLEKVRTDFVANVSHELRTPITAVKGFAETLLDGALEDEEVLVEFLTIIYNESSRLDTMVQDILQLSKLEQRKITSAAERVRVTEVIEEIKTILLQKIELRKIQFKVKEPEPLEIEIDRDQLKQVLLNLIANAVSYTHDGGEVTVYVRQIGHEAVISVKDNGVGIPKDQQSRIFERFYRVDKARSRNVGGTGLGLSIVKWILENNNGRITLKSEVKKGSDFTVWLPFKQINNTNGD